MTGAPSLLYGDVMRKCTTCGTDKPSSEFYNERDRRCRRCKTDAQLKYQRENPEKYRAIQRRTRMKSRYGITVEQYEAMLAAQDGKCAICAGADSKNPRSPDGHWSVDHDHETGEVRGLLCLRCNNALGWYEEHSEAIAAYLRG